MLWIANFQSQFLHFHWCDKIFFSFSRALSWSHSQYCVIFEWHKNSIKLSRKEMAHIASTKCIQLFLISYVLDAQTTRLRHWVRRRQHQTNLIECMNLIEFDLDENVRLNECKTTEWNWHDMRHTKSNEAIENLSQFSWSKLKKTERKYYESNSWLWRIAATNYPYRNDLWLLLLLTTK